MANNESDIEIIDGEDSSNSDLINWLQSNATQVLDDEVQVVTSSFNSIQLNNNVLTFNGVSYTLEGTAESTDTNLSSFKQISAIDNGDNTITLTVGSNSITVSKHLDYDNVLLDSDGKLLLDVDGKILLFTPASSQSENNQQQEEPVQTGYSGSIQWWNNDGYEGQRTCIKFDSAPTSYDDYDACASNSTLTGSSTYTNKNKIYVWTKLNDGYSPSGAVKINNQTTTISARTYDNAVEINLTGDYTIYLAGLAGTMPVDYYGM